MKSLNVAKAVHNFFLSGGAMSLAEVENMAALQLFTLGGGGVWGHAPQEILVSLGSMRCILRHTEKHTELLEKSLIIIIIVC